MTNVTALTADRLELGEGSRWVGDQVVLVDIPAGRLLATPWPAASPAPSPQLTELARLSVPLAAVAPLAGRRGG